MKLVNCINMTMVTGRDICNPFVLVLVVTRWFLLGKQLYICLTMSV